MSVDRTLQRGGRWLLPMALAVADGAWIWLWAAVLATWIGEPVGGGSIGHWWIFGVILAARGLTGRLRSFEPRLMRNALVVLAGLLCILLVSRIAAFPGLALTDSHWLADVAARPVQLWAGVEPVDLILLVALVCWIRGIAFGRGASSFEDVQGTFVWGIAALVTALLVIAVVPVSSAASPLGSEAIVGFLGAGLLSVALARIDEINSEQRRHQDFELGLGAHWALTLVVVLVVLLGVAVALSGVLTFDRIAALLQPLGVALDFLLAVILYAVAVPIGFLLEGFVWLVRLLLGKPAKPPQPPNFGNLAQRTNPNQPTTGLSPEMAAIFHLVAGAVVVVLVGLALYRSLVWWSDLDRVEGVPELRDFVVGWADLRAAARRWLRRLFRRRDEAQTIAPASTAIGMADDRPGHRTVREIYREFLRLGRRLGIPRGSAVTPLEYARTTAGSRSGLAGPLGRLTSRYVAVRYGETEADDEMVTESQRALDEIRAALARETVGDGTIHEVVDKRASG